MRMFVALTPPQEVIEDLADYLEPRQEVDSPLRWTGTVKWHITLAFLPSVTDRALDELSERLAETAQRYSSFTLQLKSAGTFPNPAEAKTLWVGVAGDLEPLGRLAGSTRSAAVRAGLPVDGGTFRPHLTLARMSRPLEAPRWLRVLDLYSGPTWPVGEFSLIESHLGGNGRGRTHYQVREVFSLGGSS